MGYSSRTDREISRDQSRSVDHRLSTGPRVLEDVVVTSSRRHVVAIIAIGTRRQHPREPRGKYWSGSHPVHSYAASHQSRHIVVRIHQSRRHRRADHIRLCTPRSRRGVASQQRLSHHLGACTRVAWLASRLCILSCGHPRVKLRNRSGEILVLEC